MSESADLGRLARGLPDRFDFYHLGTVEPAPDLTPVETELDIRPDQLLWDSFADDHRVGFSIRGDLSGILVVSFEQGLDVSTYMEMGNIIASRLVTGLNEKEGLDLVISAPKTLGQRSLDLLAQSTPPGAVLHKIYLHRHGDQTHSVHAFLIAAKGEGVLDA